MTAGLKKSPLFAGMSESDIEHCLRCSGAEIASYEKDELIFRQKDVPSKLLVLVEGAVAVCTDSVSGRRSLVATFDRAGELFGEVFLFLSRGEYDHYAQAAAPAKILRIPKDFLSHTCGENCGCHEKMIANLLSILAQKAYFLNRKLQIVSCASLRQKLAMVLLQNRSADGSVALPMNREELADYLNAARPSVSRELMRMREDGLVRIEKKRIFLPDPETLQNLL